MILLFLIVGNDLVDSPGYPVFIVALGDEAGNRLDLRNGVAHGHAGAGSLDHAFIVQVVADGCDFFALDALGRRVVQQGLALLGAGGVDFDIVAALEVMESLSISSIFLMTSVKAYWPPGVKDQDLHYFRTRFVHQVLIAWHLLDADDGRLAG